MKLKRMDNVLIVEDDLDAVVAHMLAHGAKLIGEMQYENMYRLAYIRGPEGIIVGLAEQQDHVIGQNAGSEARTR